MFESLPLAVPLFLLFVFETKWSGNNIVVFSKICDYYVLWNVESIATLNYIELSVFICFGLVESNISV